MKRKFLSLALLATVAVGGAFASKSEVKTTRFATSFVRPISACSTTKLCSNIVSDQLCTTGETFYDDTNCTILSAYQYKP